MDEILHHLKIPGMGSHDFKLVRNGFCPSTVSRFFNPVPPVTIAIHTKCVHRKPQNGIPLVLTTTAISLFAVLIPRFLGDAAREQGRA